MKQSRLAHEFVDIIPEQLREGVLYISLRYSTALHKCCCGCGEEVVTPLTPTDWSLETIGGKVTLDPSIGNWSYACRSHYLIVDSEVIWSGSMSQQAIEHGRAYDRKLKQSYFDAVNHKKALLSDLPLKPETSQNTALAAPTGFWSAVKGLWKKIVG